MLTSCPLLASRAAGAAFVPTNCPLTYIRIKPATQSTETATCCHWLLGALVGVMPGAAAAELRKKKRYALLKMSMQYCSPPEPIPLQIIAAPLVCTVGPFTHAAKVNLSEVSKFKVGLSGRETYSCRVGGAVWLKLRSPCTRPMPQ